MVPGTTEIEESIVAVPLNYGVRVVGAVIISKLGISQFDEDDVRLLEVLAGHAAVALENARLYENQRLEAESAKALLQFADTVSKAPTEYVVANETVKVAAQIMETPGAALWMYDDSADCYLCVAHQGFVGNSEIEPAVRMRLSCEYGDAFLSGRNEPFVLPASEVERKLPLPSQFRMADFGRGAASRREGMDHRSAPRPGWASLRGGPPAATCRHQLPGVDCVAESDDVQGPEGERGDRQRASRREPRTCDRRGAQRDSQPHGRAGESHSRFTPNDRLASKSGNGRPCCGGADRVRGQRARGPDRLPISSRTRATPACLHPNLSPPCLPTSSSSSVCPSTSFEGTSRLRRSSWTAEASAHSLLVLRPLVTTSSPNAR